MPVFVFVFLFAFFNLCKHYGDEERLARQPQMLLWFGAVNVKHTLEQTTEAECFLSLPRPPLSVGPKIRLLRKNKTKVKKNCSLHLAETGYCLKGWKSSRLVRLLLRLAALAPHTRGRRLSFRGESHTKKDSSELKKENHTPSPTAAHFAVNNLQKEKSEGRA